MFIAKVLTMAQNATTAKIASDCAKDCCILCNGIQQHPPIPYHNPSLAWFHHLCSYFLNVHDAECCTVIRSLIERGSKATHLPVLIGYIGYKATVLVAIIS